MWHERISARDSSAIVTHFTSRVSTFFLIYPNTHTSNSEPRTGYKLADVLSQSRLDDPPAFIK